MWNYMKLGPVVQEEMSFQEKVYEQRTHDEDWSQHLTLSLRLRWAKKARGNWPYQLKAYSAKKKTLSGPTKTYFGKKSGTVPPMAA